MAIYLHNKERESTLDVKSDLNRGTIYLADNPTHYEIQRGNTFMFHIKFPEGYFANDEIISAQNQYARDNASEVLRISVNGAFVPHFTTNAITLKRGNNAMKFAGVPEFSNGQIKLDDFIGAGTKDVLMAWQRKVYNVETEKVGLASDYKLNARLIEYTPDYQVVRTWVLYGCWISSIREDDYSHDSTDKRNIDCTIEYDRAKIDISDLE